MTLTLTVQERTITGCWYGSTCRRRTSTHGGLVRASELRLGAMIGRTFDLEGINEALGLFEQAPEARSVILYGAPDSTERPRRRAIQRRPDRSAAGTPVRRAIRSLGSRRDEVDRCDVAVLGVPFDGGTTFRPGARFGPIAVRQATRLLRSYHPGLEVEPFADQQVADAGDIACNPFDIMQAIGQIEAGAEEVLSGSEHLLTIGGDHTIALPLLRVMKRRHGPIALLHFDAHLDTWDTYFGAPYTHGTPFRRAWEEGLLLEDHAARRDPRPAVLAKRPRGRRALRVRDRDGDGPGDRDRRGRRREAPSAPFRRAGLRLGRHRRARPAHAPGTGTPEPGGLTSRELLAILRGLKA